MEGRQNGGLQQSLDEEREETQGSCYKLYKSLASYGACVLMKTSKFKVKVCCSLETAGPDLVTPLFLIVC